MNDHYYIYKHYNHYQLNNLKLIYNMFHLLSFYLLNIIMFYFHYYKYKYLLLNFLNNHIFLYNNEDNYMHVRYKYIKLFNHLHF